MSEFDGLNRFYTQSAKWDGMREKLKHDTFYPFTVADSDYSVAEPIITALKKRLEHGALGYTYADKDYTNTLTKFIQRRYDYFASPNHVVLAPKVLTALSLLLDVLSEESDSIVIQTPVYNMFYDVIESSNRRVIENPLINESGKYFIDFDHLESLFKAGAKVFILCSPHNPVGRVFTNDEIIRLIKLAKQYDVYLISDEIHGDIIMKQHKFVSVGHYFDMYEKLVIVSAPSKTFNLAGLQVAYMVVPNTDIRKQVKKIMHKFHIGTPNLLGLTASKAAYAHCDDWIDKQNLHIFNNYLSLKTFLDDYLPNAVLTPLEGSYLAWIDFSYLDISNKKLLKSCEQAGIIVGDGLVYSKTHNGFIRFNLAVSEEQLNEGLTRLLTAVNSL